jgi:hypothetical protein
VLQQRQAQPAHFSPHDRLAFRVISGDSQNFRGDYGFLDFFAAPRKRFLHQEPKQLHASWRRR